ncbi:ankyrin repeat-containing domain protein [Nemania serpens]|nr:ankyrin repeat-containing domain protein [Nemania serpens]
MLRSICRYEDKLAVAALKKAFSAGADFRRTFKQVLTHTFPRQYSWSGPGFDHVTYIHDLTPLHLAASAGLPDTVALLLQNGADIDAPTEQLLWTPLFVALSERQSLTAKVLIDRGASLILKSGFDALQVAAAADLLDIMTYLVRGKGMDPNSKDRNGDTPLIYALTSPRSTKESILRLLALGADPNKVTAARRQYWSPLSVCLKCERWDLAEVLLDHGADSRGASVLPSLGWGPRPEITHPFIIALLVKYPKNKKAKRKLITRLLAGVDPNMEIPSSIGRASLLSILVYRKLHWETKLLLGTGCVKIESGDEWGLTPLEHALSPSSGSLEIARLLLEHGARIPKRPIDDILYLTNNICQTPDPAVIKQTLDHNKVLGPLFQLLFNHCASIKSEDRDETMTEFLAGCPALMVNMAEDIGKYKLTNTTVLEKMKEQFEVVQNRPQRKVAPLIQITKRWWELKNIRRR